MAKRISVYIDGANFYGGLTSINKKFTDTKFDFENYIKYLVGEDILIKINYYNALVKKKINEKIWRKQNDFFDIVNQLNSLATRVDWLTISGPTATERFSWSAIDYVRFQNARLLYALENHVSIFWEKSITQ